jgi:hypothetical protein
MNIVDRRRALIPHHISEESVAEVSNLADSIASSEVSWRAEDLSLTPRKDRLPGPH